VNSDKHYTAETAFGSFELHRYPQRPRELLQAWNSADLLLLEYAAEKSIAGDKILVVNDECGALSLPLQGSSVWTDSQLAIESITRNANRLQLEVPVIIPASEVPEAIFELVLLRIPKQLSLLRYQLDVLREHTPDGTSIVCAGMDKHLPRSIAATLAAHIGPTERHRGQRKARLFSTRLDKSCQPPATDLPQFYCEQLGGSIETLPNVFSGEQLDIGSRLLLEQFPALPQAQCVVDLGCGCGVLGLAAMAHYPQAQIHFLDESDLAVANTRHNVQRLFPERVHSSGFLRADGFRGYRGAAPDLILCNPPFHQQHVVDDYSGRRLIKQAARALAPGGELWLVANRHLPYGKTMHSSFSQVEQQAINSKFIVWRARQ
jgi:23S rRNA (guanine1835-N2)-methyltransferase